MEIRSVNSNGEHLAHDLVSAELPYLGRTLILDNRNCDMATPGRALEAQAFNEALTLSSTDIANALVHMLGKTLTAYLASLPNTAMIDRWQAGEELPAEIEARLRFAYRVAMPITKKYSPAVSQAWFQGVNPELDDRVAIRLMREQDLHQIEAEILAAESVFLGR